MILGNIYIANASVATIYIGARAAVVYMVNDFLIKTSIAGVDHRQPGCVLINVFGIVGEPYNGPKKLAQVVDGFFYPEAFTAGVSMSYNSSNSEALQALETFVKNLEGYKIITEAYFNNRYRT